jgi:alkylated DNA nucleotide flippase Atl1
MKSDLITIVNEIPSGKVASYWQVAEQLCERFNHTTSGRLVGRLLSSMNQKERELLPWRRVVNKQWVVSSLKLGEKGLIQIRLLREDWVEVVNDQINMKRYWFRFG